MEAFDSRLPDSPGFYFAGDDYEYRLDFGARNRFLSVLRERFNTGVRYRLCVLKRDPDVLKWAPVIEQKTAELGRHLVARTVGLDFSKPSARLRRIEYRTEYSGHHPKEVSEILRELRMLHGRNRREGNQDHLGVTALTSSEAPLFSKTAVHTVSSPTHGVYVFPGGGHWKLWRTHIGRNPSRAGIGGKGTSKRLVLT